MNLGDLLRIIARRWVVIATFTLLGIVAVWLLAFQFPSFEPKKQSYVSRAAVMIDKKGAQGQAATAAITQIILQNQTFKQVLESGDIAARAAEKLKAGEEFTYTPEEIQDCTGAEAETTTQVMRISSCGDNPPDAVLVTTAVVDSFRDWLKQRQDEGNVLGQNRISFDVLSQPTAPTSPSGFPPFVFLMIGIFGGALLGVVVAVGIESVATDDDTASAPVRAMPTAPQPPQYPSMPAADGTEADPNLALPAASGGRARRQKRR